MLKLTSRLIIMKNLSKWDWFLFFKKLKKKKFVWLRFRRWRKNFKKIKPLVQFNIYNLYFNFKPKYTPLPMTIKIKRRLKQKNITFFFLQQSFKNAQLLVLNSKHKVIRCLLTNKIVGDSDLFSCISLLSNQFENKFNISLYVKLKHSNFFKKLSILVEQINLISFVKTDKILVFILKPNFFFINLQYKKIKSIKKSRKKLMYQALKKKQISIN